VNIICGDEHGRREARRHGRIPAIANH
jgi:hypothetical protein